MLVEKVHNEIRYTLSNQNLQVGDEVFPIAHGRCLDGGGWILHGFAWEDYVSGFPSDPHTILDLKNSDYKPEQVHTDHGTGPIEMYYKVIKMEKYQVVTHGRYSTMEWVEIPITRTASKSQ
jgi:hypothetical protein